MPHLFVNRQRRHALAARTIRAQRLMEGANMGLYLAGGLAFTFGSVFFFPVLARLEYIGVWAFVVGSICYVLVTSHDFLEVRHVRRYARAPDPRRQAVLEHWATRAYLTGAALFAAGSVLFLPGIGRETAGAWCFIVGSLVFVLGAGINVLHIVVASSLLTMQLMNLTAVAFVVGSVLFTAASAPYLWRWGDGADAEHVFALVAGQYVVASLLFVVGGILNGWRALLVARGGGQGDDDHG
jgi:hypothetical protein